MLTRKDYMEKRCTHDEYYGEIARACAPLSLPQAAENPELLRRKLAEDPHLNNIRLALWDSYAEMQRTRIGREVAKRQSGGVSLSDLVCTLKAYARILANTE